MIDRTAVNFYYSCAPSQLCNISTHMRLCLELKITTQSLILVCYFPTPYF